MARRYGADQSTISRNVQSALKALGLKARKTLGEWNLIGDTTLLDLERKVHQVWRWSERQPLRLEAQHWSGPLLCQPAPEGWIIGNFDFLDYQRPIELLRKGMIDAWVASYPDIPEPDDGEIATIRLNRMPVYLLVSPGHPLLQLGNTVTMADVARFPSLSLPNGAFPKFEAIARQCGIWNTPAKLSRFKKEDWYGQMDSEDMIVTYATPLTLRFLENKKVILPIQLPIEVGDALLLRRPFLQTPQAEALKQTLLERMRSLANQNPDLELLS